MFFHSFAYLWNRGKVVGSRNIHNFAISCHGDNHLGRDGSWGADNKNKICLIGRSALNSIYKYFNFMFLSFLPYPFILINSTLSHYIVFRKMIIFWGEFKEILCPDTIPFYLFFNSYYNILPIFGISQRLENFNLLNFFFCFFEVFFW